MWQRVFALRVHRVSHPLPPGTVCRRFAERQWLKRNTFFGKTNQEVEAIKKKLAHH